MPLLMRSPRLATTAALALALAAASFQAHAAAEPLPLDASATSRAATAQTVGFANTARNNTTLYYNLTGVDATVLDVRFSLNYVDIATNPGSFLGRLGNSAEASAKLQPTLSAGATVLHVRSATNGTQIELQTPLVLQGNAIREVKDTTSTGDTVGLVAVNLIAALAGVNSASSSKTMSAIADPADYRAVVGSNLALASEMMVSRLVAER